MAYTRRPPILPAPLVAKSNKIMAKYGILYENMTFKLPKVNPNYAWDTHAVHSFFSGPRRLAGCCGVIEMSVCTQPPPRNRFDCAITQDEWLVLFQFHVRKVLAHYSRRMAIATLIHSQRDFIPYLEAAGFQQVSTGFNPGSRRDIHVWAFSI